jgi:hypothetical protein
MEGLTRKQTLVDIVLILAVSAISFTWFDGDNIISVGDFCFPLAQRFYLNVSTFLWEHSMSMGYPAPGQLASIFPYSLFGALTESLGFSTVFFEKMMFYIWFSTSGLGMYMLCCVIDFPRLAKVFSALFYMMNPYSLLIPWHLASGLLIAGYSMTPLLLALLIKTLQTEKPSDWVVMLFIWFFFGTYSYMNPAVAVVHLLILGGYSIFHLVAYYLQGRDIRRGALLSASLLVTWLAVNAYWLIPVAQNVVSLSEGAASAAMGFISNDETFKLNSAKLLGALRLHGLWSMYGEWRPLTPYYSFAETYKLGAFVAISFLPTLFVVAALFRSDSRQRKLLLFFAGMFIFGLFFVKGAFPPFERINFWLFNNVPFFGTAFRAGFQKWGLLLSFAFVCLMGYGTSVFYEWLCKGLTRRCAKTAIAAIALLVFVIYMFPFWNGKVIFSGGGIIQGARTQIPESYGDLYDWTKKQHGEFRIFSLPLSKNSNTIYKWGNSGYSGADFIRYYSVKPVIYANYGQYYEIPLLIARKIEEREKTNLLPMFSLLNVKYLLVHDDINWAAIKESNWWINKDAKALANYLARNDELYLERKFNWFRVYRIPDKYLTPLIYTASIPLIIDGSHEDLAVLADKKFLEEKPLLIMMAGDISGKALPEPGYPRLEMQGADWLRVGSAEKRKVPHITFRKANPTRYEIAVSSATGPFWLVFGDTFNSGWKLFQGRPHIFPFSGLPVVEHPLFKTSEMEHSSSASFGDMRFLIKKPLAAGHFVANGYGNAWYVDPVGLGLGENFLMEIFFMPQSVVYAGLAFSISFSICCLLFILKHAYSRIIPGKGVPVSRKISTA